MVKVLLLDGKVRLNLTAHVGRNQTNKLDDVEFVRFAYRCVKVNKVSPDLGQKLRPQLAVMRTRGNFGNDLHDVIVAHQKIRGGTQDAMISPEKPSGPTGERYDGIHAWLITVLNGHMIDVHSKIWPRIDLDDFSGGEISAKIRELFLIP